MKHSDAVWVAQQYIRTYSPGRVGMLLSDEAELAICRALVEMSEQGITMGAACCEKEKAELRAERDAIRAQLDAVSQVASVESGIEAAVDTHIATHGAAPLVVPEDRSKPPPGYTVEPCPGGLVRWWRNGVECGPPCVLTEDAIAGAWADYDARAANIAAKGE